MLRSIREGQRWLTGLFVLALGGVFVFFLVPGMGRQGPSAGAIVEVGPYRFGIREFEAERSRRLEQYQEALGDQFDAAALEDTLNELTARVLVERSILAQEAEKLGLLVPKREIEKLVVGSALFRGADGRFDREGFDRFVQYEYGNERNFMRDQRLGMLATKMARILDGNTRVSEGEARDSLRQRLEEIRIAFVVLDDRTTGDTAEIPAEEVAAFLATREEEVRTLYHQRSEIYDAPEQVHARHILIALAPDADEATVAIAEARARAVIERIAGGEDFAAVAGEVSDDPGSKNAGGDLGTFRRGQMVKAFEDAAFSLEPGVVSDPVRSDFGLHVIRVEEHRPASLTPFEDVRESLARELIASERAAEVNREVADGLSAAVAGGQSLEEAARAADLTLERSGWLRRSPDGFVPGLGAAQDLMTTAFAMNPGESSNRVFEVDGKLAMVQLLERQLPDAADIEQGIEAERQQLRSQKQTVLAQSWLNERRSELIEAGELAVDLSVVSRRR